MSTHRPTLEITQTDAQWIVKVDGNERRWFATEKEAEAFVDGFDNCYDNFVLGEDQMDSRS